MPRLISKAADKDKTKGVKRGHSPIEQIANVHRGGDVEEEAMQAKGLEGWLQSSIRGNSNDKRKRYKIVCWGKERREGKCACVFVFVSVRERRDEKMKKRQRRQTNEQKKKKKKKEREKGGKENRQARAMM